MTKSTKKKVRAFLIILIAIGAVVNFTLTLRFILHGTNVALLNPKGFIAEQQLKLFIYVTATLLLIGIVTLLALYFTAWRYRDSNNKSTYQPKSYNSKVFIVSMWLIPTIFAAVITLLLIPATHKLVPQKVIEHDKEPMTIQVVSMNWKWLFLYPEHDVATVNFVQLPVDQPVTFEMTADESPMSSFWIPNLGGQLYTMTTHVNRLNLVADEPGDYPGRSAEINGAGFADMKFIARASSQEDFDAWIMKAKLANNELTAEQYQEMLEPSENHPVTIYSSYEDNLFAKVIQKYYETPESTEHSE